VRT
jgi:hypothetical protein